MINYALGVEYSGSAYCGWQRQKHSKSVQEEVENAIGFVANHPVQLNCAGRTDSGVHAVEQVASFQSDAERDERAWTLGSNCRLAKDIRLKWLKQVDSDFHARFSAESRSYRYIILNTPVTSALFHDKVSWVYQPLDQDKMNESAQVLVGEHDFSAFRAVGCQSNSAVRNIHQIELTRRENVIYLDIKANAFLYHMVRNIAGSLIEVGKGSKNQSWISKLLAEGDRNKAAATASAAGLYFVKAHYPERYNLPITVEKPVLF